MLLKIGGRGGGVTFQILMEGRGEGARVNAREKHGDLKRVEKHL